MNIFQKIFQHRTGTLGLENYCTDILVGLLQKRSNYQLLELFVKEVLKIEEIKSKISIETQVYYPEYINTLENNLSHSRVFIDIKVHNTEFICFLEMKVESHENKAIDTKKSNQLVEYAKVLKREIKDYKDSLPKLYLRFCTKYREDKSRILLPADINFYSLRWTDIYNFLNSEAINDEIIKEFISFLEIKNMDNKVLSSNEIQSATFSIELLRKLNIVIDNIADNCKEFSETGSTNKRLDFYRNRFGLHYIDCFNGIYNLFFGFSFADEKIVCQINIWSGNRQFLSNKWLKKYESYNSSTDESGGYCIGKEIKSEESLIEIEGWFVENINEMTLLKKQSE